MCNLILFKKYRDIFTFYYILKIMNIITWRCWALYRESKPISKLDIIWRYAFLITYFPKLTLNGFLIYCISWIPFFLWFFKGITFRKTQNDKIIFIYCSDAKQYDKNQKINL